MIRPESAAGDGREPGAHWLSAQRDLEVGGFDGFDLPAVGERVADLVLRDAARAPPRRLVLAEAEHEVLTARPSRACQAGNERRTIVVVENVEEPAVEDHVELLTQRGEVAGITDD